jgi:hypothetical protein
MEILGNKYIKFYATREKLESRLKELGFDTHKHIVVCNEEGKFTAIFSYTENFKEGGYLGRYAQYGFMLFS